ncbi:mRNA decay protein [Basidiobolus ranarum]|uniref:mRNA decay protein n=1 Tax=Basidiobolus ranarum TaxID=34480 RepID=A0ABR2X2C6_9FUNG
MMSESLESRKLERKAATLDMPIPMHLTNQSMLGVLERNQSEDQGNVAFTLLTKRGNKQQIRTVEVPSNCSLAVNTRNKQEAEREEQQQLKKLVLNYEEREEANQRQALEHTLANQGVRLTNFAGRGRGNQRNRKLYSGGFPDTRPPYAQLR